MAGTIPNCISMTPLPAHEWSVPHHGLKRMVGKAGQRVYFYITLLIENYAMPGPVPGTKNRSSRACTQQLA
jgi:pyruvate dehydrogenase complex dehydrogenase (E1) component